MASPTSPRSQPSEHSQHSSAYGAPVVQSPRPTMDESFSMDAPLPEEVLMTRSRMTQNPPLGVARPDPGYLMIGWRRKLQGEGNKQKWIYVQEDTGEERDDPPGPEIEYHPPDIYEDKKLFPNDETIVQIVTFQSEEPQPARWHRPLTDPKEIYDTLHKRPAKDEWRLILCEGFNGQAMRAVARGTGWNERKFGGIFTWTRASMEWADNVLLVHFKNQATRIYVWYGGGNYKHLVICSTLNTTDSSVTRMRDFIDRGCSRPEVVLRKDPSMMYYGIVRAVIQDLRLKAHEIYDSMGQAYKLGIAQPSRRNLSHFYYLQDKLSVLSLDTTSLKSAATSLCEAADKMHDEERLNESKGIKKPRLISEGARVMIKDQMGLIRLLANELPDISHRAGAIVDLAFNTLAFRTNNLLQVLAVITIASIPLTVATGVLGINYFDETKVDGRTIIISLTTVATAVFVCVLAYIIWFFWEPKIAVGGSGSSDKANQKQTAGSKDPSQQTAAQRAIWARMQDLLRDNELMAEENQYHPLRREFPEVSSPGPRLTMLPQPVTQPPRPSKRKTTFTLPRTRNPTDRVASPPLVSPSTLTSEPVAIAEAEEKEGKV